MKKLYYKLASRKLLSEIKKKLDTINGELALKLSLPDLILMANRMRSTRKILGRKCSAVFVPRDILGDKFSDSAFLEEYIPVFICLDKVHLLCFIGGKFIGKEDVEKIVNYILE